MYKWMALILAVALLGIQCGGEETTNLQVNIVSHPPPAGSIVETVFCIYQARLRGGDEPITATVEWWWTDVGQTQQVISSGQWTFTDHDWEDVTTFYQAAPGYVLVGEFWVRIHWRDSDGDEHSTTSNHCFLSVLGNVSKDHWEILK